MVKRTERGWAGHFICSRNCLFKRHTLLEKDGVFVVVSTVGLLLRDGLIETVGNDRFFETMAFYSDTSDDRYHDADVCRPISFTSNWRINEQDAEDRANDMHESVVDEIAQDLENDCITEGSL